MIRAINALVQLITFKTKDKYKIQKKEFTGQDI